MSHNKPFLFEAVGSGYCVSAMIKQISPLAQTLFETRSYNSVAAEVLDCLKGTSPFGLLNAAAALGGYYCAWHFFKVPIGCVTAILYFSVYVNPY